MWAFKMSEFNTNLWSGIKSLHRNLKKKRIKKLKEHIKKRDEKRRKIEIKTGIEREEQFLRNQAALAAGEKLFRWS